MPGRYGDAVPTEDGEMDVRSQLAVFNLGEVGLNM